MLFDKMNTHMDSCITIASELGQTKTTLVCKISVEEIDETLEAEEKLYDKLKNEGFKMKVTEETKTLHKIKVSW